MSSVTHFTSDWTPPHHHALRSAALMSDSDDAIDTPMSGSRAYSTLSDAVVVSPGLLFMLYLTVTVYPKDQSRHRPMSFRCLPKSKGVDDVFHISTSEVRHWRPSPLTSEVPRLRSSVMFDAGRRSPSRGHILGEIARRRGSGNVELQEHITSHPI